MKRPLLVLMLLIGAVIPTVANEERERLRSIPLHDVEVVDRFWSPKLDVYRERTIPHSWQYMRGEVRALRHAAGEAVVGDLNGTWGEANLYKFIETIAYSLARHRDTDLEQRVDRIIEWLARARQPDGYSHIFVINSGKEPWDPTFLDGSHDGYVLGHLIEAAIEYHAATGKRALLDVAQDAAAQAYEHFLGPAGQPGFCGHAELEMALVELYRVTGDPRHLALARAFVEWRGRGKVPPAGPTPRAYFQDEVPFRSQRTLEGHAVRAVFFATGVADLAIESGDCDYRLAANRFWDSVANRRMAITGSIGPRAEHEALGEDYELPLDGYYESCAACGLVDFAHRMFQLEQRAEFMDVLERVLYNAVLHGISLEGVTSYYQNPLSDRENPRYNSWVCCPPNLSRTLMQVERYAYASGPTELYVNLYVGGSCAVELAGSPVKLHVETDYPWSGGVRLKLETKEPRVFALQLRQPGWCDQVELRVNGRRLAEMPRTDAGYLRLEREWRSGDTVEIEMAMPVQRMVAHPNILACQGRLALQRGPLVYGFEGLDNAGVVQVELAPDSTVTTSFDPDLLGGITVIRGVSSTGRPIQAIPFYALANREPSTQEVWVAQTGARHDDTWWQGRLYRPIPTGARAAKPTEP